MCAAKRTDISPFRKRRGIFLCRLGAVARDEPRRKRAAVNGAEKNIRERDIYDRERDGDEKRSPCEHARRKRRAHAFKRIRGRERFRYPLHPYGKRRERIKDAHERRENSGDGPDEPFGRGSEPQHDADRENPERDADEKQDEEERGEKQPELREREAEEGEREDEHKEERSARRGDRRKDKPGEIFTNGKRRREKVKEVLRPYILEKRRRHSLHHAREKIPEDHGAEKRRGNGDFPARNVRKEARDESPEHDIEGRPEKIRHDARRRTAKQVELAQHDGIDAAHIRMQVRSRAAPVQ